MENEVKDTAVKERKKSKFIPVALGTLLVLATSSLPVFFFWWLFI